VRAPQRPIIATLAVGVVLLLMAGGCSPLSSKGTMPPPGANGEADPSAAPDFIAVAGRDGGIAGYIPKHFLFPEPTTTTGIPVQPDWPVYADDLRTLVGHMVAGKGFVPLGVDPATVPGFPVEVGPSAAAPVGEPTALTLYVRSAGGPTAWFAVQGAGSLLGAQGYNGGIGVGCIDILPGGRLVMLDRAPQDASVQPLRTIYTRPDAGDLPSLWVDIDADGAVSQGDGVPPWWQGDPQGC
jgi:hypothetical protein